MRRTGFKPKAPPRRPERQVEYTPKPRKPAVGGGLLAQALAMNAEEPVRRAIASLMKTPDRKDQRIRDSARNEECLVRIPGCPGDPAMTIWSHATLKAADKGLGLKALDLCGAYACTYCDAVVDGQRRPPPGYTREEALRDWFFGHMRSLVRLRQKGLV